MLRDKRIAALAPTGVLLAALIAIGPGQGVLATEARPFDERKALLANERNTIDVIDRYGPSVVAVSVAVRGELMSPFGDDP